MAANGISELATKELRQKAKLDIAQAKRQGKTVADDGSITGSVDSTKPYYRGGNVYDITSLPNPYDAADNINNVDETPNTGGLIQGRPWLLTSAIAQPETLAEALPPSVLVELESWYDASDGNYFVPSNPSDGQTFTQWKDKSAFAQNANPYGGAVTRASYETNELNSLSIVRFDGNDGLTINPYPGLVNATGITVFVVSKLTSNTNFPKLFGQAQSFDMFYASDASRWRFNVNGSIVDSTGANDGAFHIHTVAFDGSQSTNATRFKYRRDKVANSLTFSDVVPGQIGSTSQLDIGFYDIDTSQFMTGDIAELLIFTKALTNIQIANVENYLSTKWDL
jgi:hypothetical protein